MVDRRPLLQLLDEKGCGTTFLKAVGASLVHSMGMVGGETFSTFTGVRQGASSSCPLFTFFIDSTIEAIASFGPDRWLGNLHTLLFMDDTVIFATPRGNLHKKLFLLKEYTDKLGMVIHPSKSQFMTVNGTDTQPFVLGNMSVAYTNTLTWVPPSVRRPLPNNCRGT